MVLCEKVNGGLRPHRGKLLRRPLGVELHAWRERILAEARKEPPEVRRVLSSKGINFHAEAATVLGHMANFGFGADLSLLNKEVQPHQLTFFFASASFEEQPGRA